MHPHVSNSFIVYFVLLYLLLVIDRDFDLCPQALDEEYLKVDAQFGGVDQRKIFTLAEKVATSTIFAHLFQSSTLFPIIMTSYFFSFIFNTYFIPHSSWIILHLKLLHSRGHITDKNFLTACPVLTEVSKINNPISLFQKQFLNSWPYPI